MNELIKAIAEQCMVDKQVPCKQLDGWTSLETVRMIDPEKFAELIVRECAGLVEGQPHFDKMLDCATVIEQHFGVEE